MSNAAQVVASRPIWEGLLGEDAEGPYLLGGRCEACGFVTLGLRDICPECWARGTMTMAPIGRKGSVYTCTVIHQVPQGYDAPFAVGYVDVERGVRVFAHLAQRPSAPKPGMTVKLTAAPLRRDKDGAALIGPLYVME
jgi:uncharacterized OB-fold protein